MFLCPVDGYKQITNPLPTALSLALILLYTEYYYHNPVVAVTLYRNCIVSPAQCP